MPLTFEQFKQLRTKGLTAQQIANFEAGNHPQYQDMVTTQPKEETFWQKLVNPKTYLKSFVEGQKELAEFSGIRPVAREMTRPFINFYSGVKELTTGQKTEKVNIPLIGEVKPTVEQAGLEKAGSALNLVSVLPFLSGAKGAVKLSSQLKNEATKIYESLLKPSASIKAKAPGIIQTGLKEGISVTKSGQRKVKALIETLDSKVDDLIAQGKATGKKIDVMNLSDYITEMKEFYKNSLGGEEIISEIDDLAIKYIQPKLKQFGRYIPIEEAQKIKQGTYKVLNKFYDKLAPVAQEIKKTLTRGIKDDIANQIKEIGDINSREKALIELKPAIDSAINRLSKHDILGLKDLMVVSGEIMATKGKLLGAPTIIWKIITSPGVKSNIAMKLNKLSDIAIKDMRLGKTGMARITAQLIDYFNNLNQE